MPPGSLLEIETKNRHYRVECLGGNAVRISGHPDLCPTPVPVELQGSADKTGIIEAGIIAPDRYLRFLMDDHRPVTTSRIVKVRVQKPN